MFSNTGNHPCVVDCPIGPPTKFQEGPAFCIIKPHAIAAEMMGMLISKIEAKFKIVHMKHDVLLPWQVQDLYKHHRTKPYWPRIEAAMTCGPAMPMLLAANLHELRDYVLHLREVLPTDANSANNYLHCTETAEDVYHELELFIPEWQNYWNNSQEH